MHDEALFQSRLQAYAQGTLPPGEQEELFDMIDSGQYDHLMREQIGLTLEEGSMPLVQLPEESAARIRAFILNNAPVVPITRKKQSFLLRIAVAAAVIGLIATGIYLYNGRAESSFQALIPESAVVKKNTGNSALHIALEDGSYVKLDPGATLHYKKQFGKEKREIYLEGSGFVNVVKDPSRPFFVYSNNLVTKVLGTSFYVRENKESGRMEVAVVTGKVQVFENAELVGEGNNGVIVTPNQKVVYSNNNRHFEPALVEKPVLIKDEQIPDSTALVFENVQLRKVLKQLETAYGIEFSVENEALYNCVITGDIATSDLYTKLDIITGAINAGYDVVGTRILIRGKGCE